ncbi:TPA: SymE family type I addiction module toxin [Serratia marcescens]
MFPFPSGPLIVGYRPQGGDTSTPQITLSGKWLCEAGFAPGQHYTVKISEGCLVLVAMNTQEEALLTQLGKVRISRSFLPKLTR